MFHPPLRLRQQAYGHSRSGPFPVEPPCRSSELMPLKTRKGRKTGASEHRAVGKSTLESSYPGVAALYRSRLIPHALATLPINTKNGMTGARKITRCSRSRSPGLPAQPANCSGEPGRPDQPRSLQTRQEHAGSSAPGGGRTNNARKRGIHHNSAGSTPVAAASLAAKVVTDRPSGSPATMRTDSTHRTTA